jgi:competence protein ComEC
MVKFTFVVCAALGTAISYYGMGLFSPRALTVCVIGFIVAGFGVIGLMRVLSCKVRSEGGPRDSSREGRQERSPDGLKSGSPDGARNVSNGRSQDASLDTSSFLFQNEADYEAKRHLFRLVQRYAIALSIGFLVGLAAGKPQPVRTGLPPGRITGVYGTLLDDPRILSGGRAGNTRGMGYVSLRKTRDAGKTETSAGGKLLVFFPEGAIPRLRDFGRGSEVYLEGSMVGVEDGAGEPGGKPAREPLFRAEGVHIVKAAPAVERFRTELRLNVADRFAAYDWGGLALALLFGIKDNLDTTLSKQYQAAGCSHVLALSGMHLAIVSAVIAFFLRRPLGLKLAAVAGAVFIIGYIYLVGDLPSLNRAAIMYLLGTAVVLFNLPKDPLSVLGMAFLIQIAAQQGSGKSISFILSYLALAGILIFSEAIYGLMRGKVPDALSKSLAASIAAFIATAAVTVLFFGTLRPIGIIASLVIVPLTTFFMIGAMAALALSFAAPALLVHLGKLLSLFYALLSRLVSWAGLPPGLNVANPLPVLAITAALAVLVLFAQGRQKRELARI